MAKVIGVISAKLTPDARIPNKVILPLWDKTMLEHHIERMKAVKGLDGVFVATSRWPGNEPVVGMAVHCGVGWLAGSENDVFERHIALCDRENADAVIRIPCDSPLFDTETAGMLVGAWRQSHCDYAYIQNVPYMCSTMAELISHEALKKAHELARGPAESKDALAAITLPIWEHHGEFKCCGIDAPGYLVRPEYQLMVDVPIDYVMMAHIYGALYRGEVLRLPAVLTWLDNHPEIAFLNAKSEYSAINKRFLEAQATCNCLK